MKKWDDFLNMYWQLMDCFRSVEPLMKNLILISLLTTFPKLLVWIYNSTILKNARGENYEPMGAVVVTCLENAHVALLATLPGVMAAMVQSRVDRIKLALATRLYLSTDDTEVAEVRRFLELIELRPFEMRILRLIPVDMNLPVGLLSLCTTYLIVPLNRDTGGLYTRVIPVNVHKPEVVWRHVFPHPGSLNVGTTHDCEARS
ncbi:hypothetical protein EVAR_32850_1 [Eumeta japonica]|uniref:Uncharacterized protein n=1 Tax=Eumeta variegata TaxID=151549 RepID=A0A4C1WAN9_EUMVA|nr:hypothetical protein EVAR_32850_1 [Eumeta japonica]